MYGLLWRQQSSDGARFRARRTAHPFIRENVASIPSWPLARLHGNVTAGRWKSSFFVVALLNRDAFPGMHVSAWKCVIKAKHIVTYSSGTRVGVFNWIYRQLNSNQAYATLLSCSVGKGSQKKKENEWNITIPTEPTTWQRTAREGYIYTQHHWKDAEL